MLKKVILAAATLMTLMFAEHANARRTEAIFPPDGRQSVGNTTVDPWRKTVHLSITLDGFTYPCTGALYSHNTVVTAAHCIYDRSKALFPSAGMATPGKNGASNPFGQCSIVNYRVPAEYVNPTTTNWDRYDYGIVKLGCMVTSAIGVFAFRTYNNSTLANAQSNLAGYPAEYPSTLWQMSGPVEAVTPEFLYYTIDTTGGQSGSPLKELFDATNCPVQCVIGVHSGYDPSTDKNWAIRINQSVRDWLRTYDFTRRAYLPGVRR